MNRDPLTDKQLESLDGKLVELVAALPHERNNPHSVYAASLLAVMELRRLRSLYGGIEDLTDTQRAIAETCDAVKALLLEKNRKYGDSALNPVRVFSQADPIAQIDVRMDDKLSRIRSAQADDDEDPYTDLVGYLILRLVAMRRREGGR